jgi:hypothetical protein
LRLDVARACENEVPEGVQEGCAEGERQADVGIRLQSNQDAAHRARSSDDLGDLPAGLARNDAFRSLGSIWPTESGAP